jgi:hypothetical protein
MVSSFPKKANSASYRHFQDSKKGTEMTLQYDQNNINLRDAAPVTVTTPDLAPIGVILDTLTADGQTLVVDMFGGGSDPADPTTNNYAVLTGVAVFTRVAGVGAVQPGVVATVPVGAVPILTFIVIDLPAPDNLTQCILLITPGVVNPFSNHLKLSKIRF